MLSKLELYKVFRRGAEAGGAGLLSLSDANAFPREYMATFEDGGTVRVQLYIWNCKFDFINERYRVQLTNVPNDVILAVPGSETFVLGYDEGRDVFAAVRRTGPVGSSPSVYFSTESLDEAKISGISMIKDSRRTLITFRSDFTTAFLRSHSEMFAIAGTEAGRKTLQQISKAAIEDDDEPLQNDSGVRPRREAVIRQAVRSSTFATRVLSAYGDACAMCDIQLGLIEAAHIVPVNVVGSDDRTDNGLALCVLHHRAYDRGLVLVKPDYSIVLGEARQTELAVRKQIIGLDKFQENLRTILALPTTPKMRPSLMKLKRGLEIRLGH